MRWVLLAVIAVNTIAAGADNSISWSLGSDPGLIEEAIEMQQNEAGDVDLVHLLHRVTFTIRKDSIVEQVQDVYYYHTPEAIQNFGSDQVTWDSSSENLRFREAAVVRPSGTRFEFDPDTVNVLDTDSFDVFTDQRNVVLQLPGLTAGSISVLSYERELNPSQPYFLNEWVQSSLPRRVVEFHVTWEQSAPQWQTDASMLKCEETPTTLRCKALDVPPVEQDDEVLYADVLPQFIVAADISWDDVIAETLHKISYSIKDSEEFPGTFAELADTIDPFASIHEFVSRQIRYVSFSRGEHSHQPHKLDETLSNRYGDCKDKSVLLLALLEELGYDAYPVLVATDREIPSKLVLPSNGYFDHMVVCVRTDEGERCLDPTDAYTGADTTPGWIQGKVRLDLLPGSRPSTIPRNPYRWRFDVTNQLTFQTDGSQEELLKRSHHGEYAAWIRQSLSERDREGRQNWLEEDYEQTVTEVEEIKFEISDLTAIAEPVVIESRTSFPPMLDTSDPLDYTDLAYWLRDFLVNQSVTNTHYGVIFPGMQITSTYTYKLNNLWRNPVPGPTVNLNSRFGNMERQYEISDDTIVVHTRVDMPQQHLEVPDFELFNRFVELVAAEARIRFWAAPWN